MKIREILETVKDIPGSKAKKEFFEANKNETLELIFSDTYDGARKYYVHKYDHDYQSLFNYEYTIDENYDVFHTMLDTLSKREVTGNAAIALVEDIISQYVEEDRPVLHSIMSRNLKIGLSATTFNKSASNKIERFSVALACNLDKVKGIDPIDGNWFASRKLDGCVDYYSIIDTEFGPMPIGEIVENNISCNVKSWDGEKIVYKPIISNFKGNTNKQWYCITLQNGKTIKITENDRLMTSNGWKSVSELTINDKIMCDNNV